MGKYDGKHVTMLLECGCEEDWWEGELFPGVGEYAECMGSDLENCDLTLERGETHGTQKIIQVLGAEWRV